MLFMPRKYTRVIELEWEAKVIWNPLQGFPRDSVEDGGPSRISKYSLVQSRLGEQISWMALNLLIRKWGGAVWALLYYRGDNAGDKLKPCLLCRHSTILLSCIFLNKYSLKEMGFLADGKKNIDSSGLPVEDWELLWAQETLQSYSIASSSRSFHYGMLERKGLKWGILGFGCSLGW